MQMRNSNLLIRSIDETEVKEKGFYIPKSSMEELQVADGVIEETFSEEQYPKGSKVFFHKVVPVDVRLDKDGESKVYWFVNERDILCIL